MQYQLSINTKINLNVLRSVFRICVRREKAASQINAQLDTSEFCFLRSVHCLASGLVLAFGEGLKSILRADADRIMFGAAVVPDASSNPHQQHAKQDANSSHNDKIPRDGAPFGSSDSWKIIYRECKITNYSDRIYLDSGDNSGAVFYSQTHRPSRNPFSSKR